MLPPLQSSLYYNSFIHRELSSGLPWTCYLINIIFTHTADCKVSSSEGAAHRDVAVVIRSGTVTYPDK